jgi:hypothetical protein
MITVSPNVRSIIDHDGGVLLDIFHNTMVTLDATGAYIWQRLERGLQMDAIAAELVRDTGADAVSVAQDVDIFIQQLNSNRLVSLAQDSAAVREC